MNRLEVKNAVVEVLHARGIEDASKESESLKDDLGLDSLDLVELDMDCEKRFEIKINPEESAEWRFISDVVTTVKKCLRIKEVKDKDPPLV